MNLKVKRLRPDALLPQYLTEGAGVFDLFAAEGGVISPGQVAKIPLGIAVEIPEGHALFIAIYSGIAYKTALRQPNGIGVNGSDYRGELAVLLNNTDSGNLDDNGVQLSAKKAITLEGGEQTWDVGKEYPNGTYLVRKGDRVAKGFILPLPRVELIETDDLSTTNREIGGFGRTELVVEVSAS